MVGGFPRKIFGARIVFFFTPTIGLNPIKEHPIANPPRTSKFVSTHLTLPLRRVCASVDAHHYAIQGSFRFYERQTCRCSALTE